MVAGMPSKRAASAIACAWLPDENATTPARRCARVEARQRIEGAAELEGAHALEVLALEEHARRRARASAVRERQHRRAVGVAFEAARGGGDIVVGRQGKHGVLDRLEAGTGLPNR